jgi:hypothetical protein
MSDNQIFQLLSQAIEQLPVVVLLAWLFLQERNARIAAEKRERNILRDKSGLPKWDSGPYDADEIRFVIAGWPTPANPTWIEDVTITGTNYNLFE